MAWGLRLGWACYPVLRPFASKEKTLREDAFALEDGSSDLAEMIAKIVHVKADKDKWQEKEACTSAFVPNNLHWHHTQWVSMPIFDARKLKGNVQRNKPYGSDRKSPS